MDVEPKIVVFSQKSSIFPQIIHLFIGCSIIFTIHFGVQILDVTRLDVFRSLESVMASDKTIVCWDLRGGHIHKGHIGFLSTGFFGVFFWWLFGGTIHASNKKSSLGFGFEIWEGDSKAGSTISTNRYHG